MYAREEMMAENIKKRIQIFVFIIVGVVTAWFAVYHILEAGDNMSSLDPSIEVQTDHRLHSETIDVQHRSDVFLYFSTIPASLWAFLLGEVVR